jgi:hypothetical protein
VNVTQLSDAQIEGVLTGMPYPAHLWEIVAWAEHNGAWPVVLDVLYKIPNNTYSGAHEIVDAARARSALTGSGQGCNHRRHPKSCPARRDFSTPLAS